MSIPASETRCTFLYVDGRRCRMERMDGHPYLCRYHWEKGQEANDAIVFASQLIEPGQQLTDPQAAGASLTGLFRMLATGRIQPRQAAVMAYLCQLSMQVFPHIERRRQSAEEARGETSPVFDTIQKGSFEESVVMNMLSYLRGREDRDAPLPADPTGNGHSPEPPPPGSIAMPGSSLVLPPPLEPSTEMDGEPPPSTAQECATPPGPRLVERKADSTQSAEGHTPPYGLTPEEEARLTEAGRPLPEEDLQRRVDSEVIRRREERAREFGPPVLTPVSHMTDAQLEALHIKRDRKKVH